MLRRRRRARARLKRYMRTARHQGRRPSHTGVEPRKTRGRRSAGRVVGRLRALFAGSRVVHADSSTPCSRLSSTVMNGHALAAATLTAGGLASCGSCPSRLGRCCRGARRLRSAGQRPSLRGRWRGRSPHSSRWRAELSTRKKHALGALRRSRRGLSASAPATARFRARRGRARSGGGGRGGDCGLRRRRWFDWTQERQRWSDDRRPGPSGC